MDVEAVVHPDQRREQPDRAGAGDQRGPRLPERPRAHRPDLLPGLGHHGGRLEQHPEDPQRGVELGVETRLDPPPLRHEAVDLLDAPLGVEPVAAHVPLTRRAVGARHRVRPPDDADHQVPGRQARHGPGIQDPAQGLVAEDEPLPARGRPAVGARGDLHVRPADPDGDRFDQDRAHALVRLGNLLVSDRPGNQGLDGHGLHRAAACSAAARGARIAWESMPPEIVRASNPFCRRIRVAE